MPYRVPSVEQAYAEYANAYLRLKAAVRWARDSGVNIASLAQAAECDRSTINRWLAEEDPTITWQMARRGRHIAQKIKQSKQHR